MIRVVKIGGNVLDDEAALDAFCRDFAMLEGPRVLVHGGGALASRVQAALGQTPVKIEGRRVTDEETLKVVTMVYSGWCNKHLVALLQKYGCNAMGLSGCDASAITASRRAPRLLLDGVTRVDYGFIGDVTPASVDVDLIRMLLQLGITPVFCAINHDGNGQLLNTNADTMASCIASALEASLICCFEMDGVLADKDDPSSLIPEMDMTSFLELVAEGKVDGGMIPKIENCFKALISGAVDAVIKNSSNLLKYRGTSIKL